MFILLPPSEGKTAPTHGDVLDLQSLLLPELAPIRQQLIDALITASAGGPSAINAPPRSAAEVEANQSLISAPTAPAAEIYTGVLYAAAGLHQDIPQLQQRAAAHVRIASTLFGFISPQDKVPAYRLPPSAKLEGIGAPIPFLAKQVAPLMDALAPKLVLDCRSGPYERLWRPTCPWISVKAVEFRDGKPVVVSHFAKHHRGVFTRHLLTRSGAMPTTVGEVLHAAQELVGSEYQSVNISEGKRGASVLELTLI